MKTNLLQRQSAIRLVITIVNLISFADVLESSQSKTQIHPTLYRLHDAGQQECYVSSPEIFFYTFAEPSLSLLYHRSKALFGILMDEIETSLDEESLKNDAREEWNYIAKTVKSSLNSAVDRLETEWEYFILLHNTVPLPWENKYKLPLIYEAIGQLEYGYLMVEAVIQSGIKEIVGMLQFQLVNVLKELDDEVSKLKEKNPAEAELNLLEGMKRGLSQMNPSFTTKLLEKVVLKAMNSFSSSFTSAKANNSTFISEPIEQMAILFHAFREKGVAYPNFWSEMAVIFPREFKLGQTSDIQDILSDFIQSLTKNQNKLINLIIQIISREAK